MHCFHARRTLKATYSLFSLYHHCHHSTVNTVRSACYYTRPIFIDQKAFWSMLQQSSISTQSKDESKNAPNSSADKNIFVTKPESEEANEVKTVSKTLPDHKISSVIVKVASQLATDSIDIKMEGNEVVWKHQGFGFSDFDRRTGNPDLLHVLQYVMGCRMFVYNFYKDSNGKSFFDFPALTEKQMTFMISSEAKFSKAMYDAKTKKDPLVCKLTMRHIGKTSYTTKASLCAEDGTFLVDNCNRVVFVDQTTRKPTTLPEWWFKKYQYLSRDENQLKVDRLLKPDNTECFRVKVNWSDTDNNDHTNWASYHKFCWDAANYFARKTLYKTVSKERLQNGIRSYQCVYSGESEVDDMLDIFSWEFDGDLKFDIEKGGNSIFQTTIKLF